MEKDKLGKEVVEYCKQYEGTDKYDVAMLAIAKGYKLGEEDLEISVKEHALGFADFCSKHEVIIRDDNIKRWAFYAGDESYVMTTEELFDNYLKKLKQ